MPRMRGLAIVVALPLITSCGDRPWTWQGTTDFTSEERAQIEEAQAFVCAKTNRECRPIEWVRAPADPQGYGIVRDESLYKDAKHTTLGVFDGRLFLRPGPTMRRVAAHEFGHVTGMTDLPPGAGLMSHAIPSNDLEWTDADEQECRRVECRR